jgi:gliding motility-associated-like protein
MEQLLLKYSLPVVSTVVMLVSHQAVGQSPVVCPINAGADQTICVPNCANLTGTFVPTNQTTNYTTSVIPYAPDPFNAGTAVNLFDDQWSQNIALPFTFCFYGTAYNNLVIGSNGLVSFNVAQAGGYCQWPINAAVPTPANPMNSIMGPWHDLNPGLGGSIRYATYGTAPCRRFVVSWNAVPMFSCGTPVTQQLVLYETTNIIDNFIQTKPICSWNSGRAIQAVHNQNGTQAVVQAGRNSPLQWTINAPEGRRWTPSGANTYTIGWFVGPTQVGNTAAINVCPTVTTTYTFQATYTNCNNQTVTVSDQVIVNVSSLTVTAIPTTANICTGGNTQLSANAAGATSWSWSPAIGLSATNISNPVASPTVTTTYTVTATDASGCSGTAQVTVNVTPMTTADAGIDDTVCTGTCINLNASGGVSYVWNADPSIVGSTLIPNPQVCPTATTTYTVTVTDANGCTGTDQVTVHVAAQQLGVTLNATNATCFGSCDGSITTNVTGGYPPYTYSWSNAATTNSINGLCANTYNVTVTDAIGCTATATVSITEPTAVDIQATSIQSANCGLNDGSITITVTGGNGPYTIQWPSGNSGLTENNLASGQVCVYAYDVNGCGDTLCVTVPNTPGADVTIISNTPTPCFGSCEGQLVAATIGGTGPYTYSWSPSGGNTDTASLLCAGTYTVTMTDANGCQDTAIATIIQPSLLTVAGGANGTICIGQTYNLSATAAGGTAPYTYDWTDGTNASQGQTWTVNPVVTTTYTVTVTDANGCVSQPAVVTVTVNPPLQVTASADQIVCQGTQVTFSANGSGGDGNLTYTWLPLNTNGSSQTTTVQTTTTYTVVVTDGCGSPAAIDSITVTINPAPIVTFAATSDLEDCATHCVSFINNTPNTQTVTWAFGNNLGTSSSATPTFCFSTPGSYDVTATVTDVIGCTSTLTLTNYVTVYPNPVADFSATPNPATLLNNTVQFTDQSFGATTWLWSFGQDDSASVLQNPSYQFNDSGTVMVQLIVANQYGCTDSITLPILIREDYAIYIPNAFTPNGDGLNELFFPQGIGINPDKYSMYIFDLWGNMIYQTTTWPGGWDGTVQGSSKVCQIDTYVYKISTVSPDGSRRQYIGAINLIR